VTDQKFEQLLPQQIVAAEIVLAKKTVQKTGQQRTIEHFLKMHICFEAPVGGGKRIEECFELD
jgi:hypothetical protein